MMWKGEMFEVEMGFDLSEALVMIAENSKKVFVSIKTFVFIIDKSNIRFGKAIFQVNTVSPAWPDHY